MTGARLRPATPADWPAMRAIFVQGIATGQSSFETPESVPERWEQWVEYRHANSVFVIDDGQSQIRAWGALAPTSSRWCYRGVAEVQLYVAGDARGRGLGRRMLAQLIEHSEQSGLWTLQAVVFPENQASRRLFATLGFREVGRREKIARMNGEWRDTLLLERRSPVL